MGFFSDFREFRRKRIEEKAQLKAYGSFNVDAGVEQQIDMDSMEFLKAIQSARQVMDERSKMFEQYKRMEKDGTIQSALELVADDATQRDPTTDHIVMVDSKYKGLKMELEDFLYNSVKIESRIWGIAYQYLLFGEAFVKTFWTETLESLSNRRKTFTLPFFELINDPTNYAAVTLKGEIIGYLVRDNNRNTSTLYAPEEFVHFISDRAYRTQTIKGTQQKEKQVIDPYTGETRTIVENVDTEFNIRVGSSFLSSSVKDYQTLDLIESIILGTRLSRSSFYRLFGIEVGNADQKETKRMIDEFKTAIAKREAFNKDSGEFTAENAPLQVNSNIYYPTRSGKNAVTVQGVGGDIDVKDLVDLDYFRNKLFGDLHIPSAYLGYTGDMPGGIGDTSLTRLDAKYARTVARCQTVLKNGITAMCKLHLRAIGKENMYDRFEIRMAKITTAEDYDMRQDILGRTELASSVMDLVERIDPAGTIINRKRLMQYLAGDVMKLNDFMDEVETPNLVKVTATPKSEMPVDGSDFTPEEDAGPESPLPDINDLADTDEPSEG